jgi:hypothetical protein
MHVQYKEKMHLWVRSIAPAVANLTDVSACKVSSTGERAWLVGLVVLGEAELHFQCDPIRPSYQHPTFRHPLAAHNTVCEQRAPQTHRGTPTAYSPSPGEVSAAQHPTLVGCLVGATAAGLRPRRVPVGACREKGDGQSPVNRAGSSLCLPA